MLAGGAAAEVDARDEDGGVFETFIVEGMIGFFTGLGIEADVVEGELAESVEGEATAVLKVSAKVSRASAIFPSTAAAATMTGDMRMVRPIGDPWRPLKLRFELEAQI
jgi:hypothetical protein